MQAYEVEYNEVISIMSRICRHLVAEARSLGKSIRVDEREVINLAPRIIALGEEYTKHFSIMAVG